MGEDLELTIKQLDIVIEEGTTRKMGVREEEYHSCISFKVGDGEGVNPVYNHIDNEFFSPHYRKARQVLQEVCGLTAEELAEEGVGLFLRNYLSRFVKELKTGDEVKVYSKFYHDEKERIFTLKAKHVMVRNGEFIHEKVDTLIFTDLVNGGFLMNLDNYDNVRKKVDLL